MQHDGGPETGAILAKLPGLPLGPTPAPGFRQQLLRRILREEETGEVHPQTLGFVIAGQESGALVPTRNLAFRAEHVDGVVADSVQQRSHPHSIEKCLRSAALELVSGVPHLLSIEDLLDPRYVLPLARCHQLGSNRWA